MVTSKKMGPGSFRNDFGKKGIWILEMTGESSWIKILWTLYF